MVKVTESGMNRWNSSQMSSTIMQRLTFITFMVSEKTAMLKFLCHAGWSASSPAGLPNTDHYITDSQFSCKSKTGMCNNNNKKVMAAYNLEAYGLEAHTLNWHVYTFPQAAFNKGCNCEFLTDQA